MKKVLILILGILLFFIGYINIKAWFQDQSAPVVSFTSDTAVVINGEVKDFVEFYDETELAETSIDDVAQLEDGEHEVCAYAIDTSKNQTKECQIMNIIHYDQNLHYDYKNINLEELMQSILTGYDAEDDSVSITYENLITSQKYEYNSDLFMTAASTIKLPLNMIYYDLIEDGEYQEDSLLYYSSSMQEAGAGYTASEYAVNSYIPLSYLLHQSIVYSDNTAANVLIQELGFQNFRSMTASYVAQEYPEIFYTDNLVNGKLLAACLKQLYEHADHYETLLNDMKDAMPNDYFNTYLQNVDIAHKYGSYNGYEHDAGIVFANQPFLLVVMSNQAYDAQELISEIALALYEYQMFH